MDVILGWWTYKFSSDFVFFSRGGLFWDHSLELRVCKLLEWQDTFASQNPVSWRFASSYSGSQSQIPSLIIATSNKITHQPIRLGGNFITDSRHWSVILILQTLIWNVRVPSSELTYPFPSRHNWVDDFPIHQVGYVRSLEGMLQRMVMGSS